MLFLALGIMVNSCRPKALEPSFLTINEFRVVTDPLTQGSAKQQITEVVVYVDDQNAGVYHLPARVPLAIDGTHKITLGPAVIENAIASNARYAYTFLKSYDTTLTLVASKEVVVNPSTVYRSIVKFKFIEDFENPVSLFGKTVTNNLDTMLRDSIPADNIEPGHCALFNLPNGVTMEYATRNEYDLPTSSESATFLEINYKSELPLALGLYINEPTTIIKTGVVTLNPKAEWSKAYINLTTVVSVKPLGTKFRFFVSALNSSGNYQKVYIDNIKLLHFE